MANGIYEFGDFTLNRETFELSRKGHRLRLERKPLELLVLLVARHGQIVTRDEIAERLWEQAVFVDIEHGINTAVRKIRQTLGDSPELPKFVQTISGTGYRFVAPIQAAEPGMAGPSGPSAMDSAEPAAAQSVLAPGEMATDARITPAQPRTEVRIPQTVDGKRLGAVALWALAVPVALAAGLGVWHWTQVRHARVRDPVTMSLAVLPLRNLSGDPGKEYFADGTTDELTTELARLPTLRVVSWNSALQKKSSAKPLQTIARELGADTIVEGSVAISGTHLRINTQLIDPRTDHHLWAGSFEGPADEAMALEQAAAEGIVSHLQGGVAATNGSRTRGRADAAAVNPAAHDAYLRGRSYFDRRKGLASAEEFQRAIGLAPEYAPAYAGLALALESQALLTEAPTETVIPKAMAAAQRCLEMDPENGDALIAKGSVELLFWWKWAEARSDLTRGVRQSPGNSFGRMMLSLYFEVLGRPEQGLRHMQEAIDIDPLSFFMARQYGSALFYSRRYDEALHQLVYTRGLHPDSAGVVDAWIRNVYDKKGMHDEAVRYDLLELQDVGAPVDLRGLSSRYRTKGWQSYWKARLEMYKEKRPEDPCQSYEAGLVAIMARDRDRALTELQRAMEQHCYWMTTLRTDPLLDDVRGDPRFDRMTAELHLPEGR